MKKEVHKLPEKFIERLYEVIPASKIDSVLDRFTEETPTTFRVNHLKSSPSEIKQALQREGFTVENVSWYRDAFILKKGRLRDLQKTAIYNDGHIYVQSLSSMIPPLILEPQTDEDILDMTAAPGSKTTQIASMAGEGARIVANDNNKVRFFKLKSNVEQQGAGHVKLTMYYGEGYGRKQPESYDRVLLDAPCSAEGRFFTGKPASYKFWKPNKVKEMVRKQKKLFFSAIETLRPGGVLVYSTCTYAPEENEGVLDWAIRKFEDKIEIEKVKSPCENYMSGIKQWKDKEFHPSVSYGLRILPTTKMEGFFVAKLRKK